MLQWAWATSIMGCLSWALWENWQCYYGTTLYRPMKWHHSMISNHRQLELIVQPPVQVHNKEKKALPYWLHCVGNSNPRLTGKFPSQRASNVESLSMTRLHHAYQHGSRRLVWWNWAAALWDPVRLFCPQWWDPQSHSQLSNPSLTLPRVVFWWGFHQHWKK